MAVKAKNFSVKNSSTNVEGLVKKIEPPIKNLPTKSTRVSGNVAVKLIEKMAESKRLLEEKKSKQESKIVPSYKDVVAKAVIQAEKEDLKNLSSFNSKTTEKTYNMSLSMKDQIIKSSKYMQDLTLKENN
jgi:hypothetical protein